jgi:hypothetical protein
MQWKQLVTRLLKNVHTNWERKNKQQQTNQSSMK